MPNAPIVLSVPLAPSSFNHTDEIFMAWNYSHYIGYVAAQGKKEYPLPMYVNTWLVQPNDLGAGDYPSGGPEPLVQTSGGPAGRRSTSWRQTSTCRITKESSRPTRAMAIPPGIRKPD